MELKSSSSIYQVFFTFIQICYGHTDSKDSFLKILLLCTGYISFVTDITHFWVQRDPALYVGGFAIHLWFSMLLS